MQEETQFSLDTSDIKYWHSIWLRTRTGDVPRNIFQTSSFVMIKHWRSPKFTCVISLTVKFLALRTVQNVYYPRKERRREREKFMQFCTLHSAFSMNVDGIGTQAFPELCTHVSRPFFPGLLSYVGIRVDLLSYCSKSSALIRLDRWKKSGRDILSSCTYYVCTLFAWCRICH